MSTQGVFVHRVGFRIRTKADMEYFILREMAVGCCKDIQDIHNQNMYYRMDIDKDGRFLMGHAEYGPNELLAMPVVMLDGQKAIEMLWKARASVNKSLQKMESNRCRRV